MLYYLDERPVDEVAEMMGLPVNTVKTHLHRARASLAAALGNAGGGGRMSGERRLDARLRRASRARHRAGIRVARDRARRARCRAEPADPARAGRTAARARAARRLRARHGSSGTVAGVGAAGERGHLAARAGGRAMDRDALAIAADPIAARRASRSPSLALGLWPVLRGLLPR